VSEVNAKVRVGESYVSSELFLLFLDAKLWALSESQCCVRVQCRYAQDRWET
jgi:hypothetical protein